MAAVHPARQAIRDEKALRAQIAALDLLGVKPQLPETRDPTTLAILKTLDRPRQALFQAFEGLVEGQDPEEALSEVWGALTRGSEEHLEFGDILQSAGMEDGWLTTSAGFAGSIALDPLNFLPIGLAGKLSMGARTALLKNPQSRKALDFMMMALTDPKTPAIIRGPVAAGRQLYGWLNMRAPLDPRTAERFTDSIESRIQQLEGQGVISRQADGSLEILQPTFTRQIQKGRVTRPVEFSTEEVIADLNVRGDLAQRIFDSHLEGRFPHQILADAIYRTKRNSIVAKNGTRSRLFPQMAAYVRKIHGFSDNDMVLTFRAAQEMRVSDPTRLDELLRPILAQADNAQGVREAASNFNMMEDALENIDRTMGIKVPKRDSFLRPEQRRIMGDFRRAIAETTSKSAAVKNIISFLESNVGRFSTREADRQAGSLASVMKQYERGIMSKDDVISELDSYTALRQELPKHPAIERFKGISEEFRMAGDEGMLDGQSAFQTIFDKVTNRSMYEARAAAEQTKLARLKALQEIHDTVPGWLTTYLPEKSIPALRTLLMTSATARANVKSMAHANMLNKKWHDNFNTPIPMDEVKRVLTTPTEGLDGLIEEGFIKQARTMKDRFLGREGNEGLYFGLTPAKALAIRAQGTLRGVEKATWEDGVVRIFGDYDGPNGVRGSTLGFGQPGAMFDPEIARHLKDMQEFWSFPGPIRTLLRHYDRIQSTWVAGTLFPVPAYHFANAISDLMLMSWGGFFTRDTVGRDGLLEPFWRAIPDYEAIFDYVKAQRVGVHTMTGNALKLKNIKVLTSQYGEIDGGWIRNMAHRENVIDAGFFGGDLERASKMEVGISGAYIAGSIDTPMGAFPKLNIKNIASLDTAANLVDLTRLVRPSKVQSWLPVAAGKEMAAQINNTNRLAMFIKRLRSGDSVADAAEHARKWLLPYDELSPVMEQAGKRAFPFITWTAKVIPRTLETLFNNPQKINRINIMMAQARQEDSLLQPFLTFLGGDGEYIGEDEMPRPIDIPDWARRAMPFPLRRGPTGELEFWMAQRFIPFGELDRIDPRQWGRTFLDMLSPNIKLPLETFMERNLYFDRALEGEAEWNGIMMDARLANALNNIRLLGDFDRLNFGRFAGFSNKRLRPETRETPQQTILRAFTGLRIYPIDSRQALSRNYREALRLNARRLRDEKRAKLKSVTEALGLGG